MKPALPQSTALSLSVAVTQQFCRAKLRNADANALQSSAHRLARDDGDTRQWSIK
jgi:hypothetical protein